MRVSWSDLDTQYELLNQKLDRTNFTKEENCQIDGLNTLLTSILAAFENDGMCELVAVNEDEEYQWVNRPDMLDICEKCGERKRRKTTMEEDAVGNGLSEMTREICSCDMEEEN